MSWNKFDKLVSLVRERVTTVILYRMKDPRVGFVTVTKVELSRDLKILRVFYSVLGGRSERSRTAHALDDARGFVRTEVGRALHTRVVPEVQFHYDDSAERSARISSLLKDLVPPAGEGDAGAEAGPRPEPGPDAEEGSDAEEDPDAEEGSDTKEGPGAEPEWNADTDRDAAGGAGSPESRGGPDHGGRGSGGGEPHGP